MNLDMNLGIDFGSTYSMLAVYDRANRTVHALTPEGGSPYIPSLACYDEEGTLMTGLTAKEQISYMDKDNPDVRLFRAFKMLLTAHPERDRQLLCERGYTGEDTPEKITREFLRQQMDFAKGFCDVKKFKNIVICIPEVWDTELRTMGGRDTLLHICQELDAADKITVVTEPAAASAYFTHNYWKNCKKPYQGKILIIDYGGGTLDITLADVSTVGNAQPADISPDYNPDDMPPMEIQTLWQTGAGDNHPPKNAAQNIQVGDAGIAYMEEAIRLAMGAAGMDIPPDNDVEFLQLFTRLESFMINNVNKFNTHCKKYNTNPKRMGTDQKVFVTLRLRGKTLPVTYAVLYQAYQNIIYPVLNEQLDIIINKIRSKLGFDPVHPLPVGQEDFKIALVGGFGQFYLVRQQVTEKFHLDYETNDPRLRGLDAQGVNGVPLDNGKAGAICYGAALIANGVITMRSTALYSIGLILQDGEYEDFGFALRKGQKIEYNTVYYILDKEKHPLEMYYGGPFSSEPTWTFAFWREDEVDRAYKLEPCKEVQRNLEAHIPPYHEYIYGFSMDPSGVYTFHIREPNRNQPDGVGKEVTSRRLGRFSDIVGANIDLGNCQVVRKIDRH